MAALPKKVTDRMISGLKKFQPIIASAKSRDVNESDTVVLVTDVLHDVFGFDKYSEITSEHAIRGTFCDLAVRLNGALAFLIEIKAIGIDLKDPHVKQAVDYAANQGVEWVLLTNAVAWRVYRVTFGKPIDSELVVEMNLADVNVRNAEHLELVGLLAKEGWQKANLGDYHTQRQALSRFTLGALLLSDPILDCLRREVRKMAPEVRVTVEQICAVLRDEVIKRDVLEGDKADGAKRTIARTSAKAARAKGKKAEKNGESGGPVAPAEPAPTVPALSPAETTDEKE